MKPAGLVNELTAKGEGTGDLRGLKSVGVR